MQPYIPVSSILTIPGGETADEVKNNNGKIEIKMESGFGKDFIKQLSKMTNEELDEQYQERLMCSKGNKDNV